MGNVSISKGLLAALAGSTLTSLFAVAFLLGRATAPREGPGWVRTQGGEAQPRTGYPGSSPEPGSMAVALPRDPFVAPPVPSPQAPVQGQAIKETEPAQDPERRSVEAYFSSLDQIQPAGLTGSPDTMANEMAAALAKGDSSSLDALVGQLEGARERLLAVSPPPPCAAHYRETVASAESALDMLRTLKMVTGSADPAALLVEITSQATALRTRSEALKREEEILRVRYGLAR